MEAASRQLIIPRCALLPLPLTTLSQSDWWAGLCPIPFIHSRNRIGRFPPRRKEGRGLESPTNRPHSLARSSLQGPPCLLVAVHLRGLRLACRRARRGDPRLVLARRLSPVSQPLWPLVLARDPTHRRALRRRDASRGGGPSAAGHRPSNIDHEPPIRRSATTHRHHQPSSSAAPTEPPIIGPTTRGPAAQRPHRRAPRRACFLILMCVQWLYFAQTTARRHGWGCTGFQNRITSEQRVSIASVEKTTEPPTNSGV